ncbi:3-hydroxybutyrate dehydrogenase [Paralimibaculum aggregatum]|uniref:3-hydroxybutyrate dehydrogenase n=1 Tax=Paralimibaculum aggregatum TaxID=3036245 RepID=A0ABQ6LMG1_9RHOB|nr:SDR family NAD(P)-dependent oxidoreductase [Limibaculum sp. NKW23]GMG83484.1 3-hydroxybutyrate dehydrogenase [Limibaculum sp. NKW23]
MQGMGRFLEGRRALVTGSVQGIGLAIAEALAGAGARIGLHGLAEPEGFAAAEAALAGAGAPEVRRFAADLRDPAAIDAMMDAAEGWGGVDILVNNAGIQRTVSLAEATPEIWDAVLAVNLSGPFHTMRRALPAMAARGYGRVVNIASVHGLVASVEKAPYVSSKFGLVGLSRVAALEYAGAGSRESGGVTVNCICPGWTETAIIAPQIEARAAAHGGDRAAGIASLLAEKQPSRRTSDPAEIGALALWLCAPIAHNVTGTSIPVDGGWTAQ